MGVLTERWAPSGRTILSSAVRTSYRSNPIRLVSAVVLGAIAGFTSLAFAFVGLVLVVLLTVLTLIWLRRWTVALGLYIGSLGATALAVLMPVVIGNRPCEGNWNGGVTSSTNCYAPSTVPALIGYLTILAIGLTIVIYGVVRSARRSRNAVRS